MDQQRLTELLHLRPDEISGQTPSCPRGEELAALLEGNLEHADRARLEDHLANCNYCRSTIVVLARLWRGEENVPVPEILMARAERLGKQVAPRRVRHAPKWAAAAVVVLSLVAVLSQVRNSGPGLLDSLQTSSGEQARQVRNVDPSYRGPKVLYPLEGSRMSPGNLTFRWTEVPGSLYYDIRVVDAEGYVLWQERVKTTAATLPAHLAFVSGEPYFVRVDAYLAEAKSVSSSHVKFVYQGKH